MSKGYFIGLDDKTTCGGKVLDGDNRVTTFGLLHACEGDRVSCGKDGGTYRIRGWHCPYREPWQACGWHAGQFQRLPL